MTPNILIISQDSGLWADVRHTLEHYCGTVISVGSRHAAVEQLDRQPATIVIAELDSPDILGEELLAYVGARYPETRRVGVTCRSKMDETITALHAGRLESYIMRPWTTLELDEIVSADITKDDEADPIEEGADDLKRQPGALQIDETCELRAFPLRPVRPICDAKCIEELANLYVSTVSTRAPRKVNLCARVRELAQGIGIRLNLDPERLERLEIASSIHRVGELALPDEVVDSCFIDHTLNERTMYNSYPSITAKLFKRSCEDANLATVLTLHRQFYLDQKLSEHEYDSKLLLEAQILCAATEYEELMLMKDDADRDLVQRFMNRSRGLRYNPKVVDLLFEIVGH